MEKSTKRAWKVSLMLITLAVAMGLLSAMVFADSVSDSFDNEDKIASKSNVEVAGGQVKLTSSANESDQQQIVKSRSHKIKRKITEEWWAQSFVAGKTGNLTKVKLWLKEKNEPEDLVIEIRNAVAPEGYDVPGEEIYASVSVEWQTIATERDYEFTFPNPYSITEDFSYTIVLRQEQGELHEGGEYEWGEGEDDKYPTGNNSKSTDEGVNWKRGGSGHDMYFETYVLDVLDQQQIVKSRSHKIKRKITEEWWAQSFVAGKTGNLTKVKLWLKEKNEPEDLVIEIRNAVAPEGYDVPGEEIYASVSVEWETIDAEGDYEFTFPNPYSITKDSRYTIVLRQEQGELHEGGEYEWGEGVGEGEKDQYPAGNNSKSKDDGDSWSRGGTEHDMYFETYVSAYNSPGELISTNLLSGETVGSIDSFSCEASDIPTGTGLKVQFSQDDTNWYNSAGTAGGWEILEEGTHTINLSGLGWSGANLYYRMNFTSDGSNTSVLDEIGVTFSGPVAALTVTNSTGASNLTTTTVRLNGEVTSTGGENPTVHIYWGDNDGGTTEGDWDYDENLETKGKETFYKDISNLTPNTTYYYRCYATNSGGNDWADGTVSFTTPGSTGSISTNADPLNISADGEATSTITATVKDQSGNNAPDGTNVTFTTDHGTLGSREVTRETSGGVATAILTSESSTEIVIATVTAKAWGVLDSTAVFFSPEGSPEVEETESKDVSDTGGTIPSEESPTGGEITVSGSSIPEGTVLTVAKYASNPVGDSTFATTEDYFDAYLNDDTGVTSMAINFSPVYPKCIIYYWDGASWGPCSDQTYSDASVVVTITDSTFPNLSDLSGLVFSKSLLDIVINDDATFTNSRSVTLTLSAITATQLQFSNDASSWSDWEDYSTTKSWTLSSGDGAKTVYVKLKDTTGNISEAYSDDITLDTTAPSGSISINNGATYTDSGSVTFSLSASDNLSGVSQMMISNSSSFEDASWEDYAAEKSWTLPSGDGKKEVYVKFKDELGNVSEIYSDEIILDTSPPTVAITSPSADTSVKGSVAIKGTASDENFKEYKVEYGQGTEPSSWTEITSSTSQVTDDTLATWDTASLNDSSYTLRLTAEDLAGNSAQTQVSLRVDNHPPQATLIDYPTDTVTGNTPRVEVNFTWTGSDPDEITPVEKLVYQYKLEGHLDYQDWSDWSSETTKTYILPLGSYTFKVRTKDEAGNYPDENDPATAKSSFTVSLPIIIYPNPCRLNQGQTVTIANLPLTSDVKIYIYDPGGNLIRTLGESEVNIEGGSKTATWDCRNDNGEVVTRDIYIYFIPSAIGKKTGKIAIIR